jgi:hypothetical protein
VGRGRLEGREFDTLAESSPTSGSRTISSPSSATAVGEQLLHDVSGVTGAGSPAVMVSACFLTLDEVAEELVTTHSQV